MSESKRRSEVGGSICGLIESARGGAMDARDQLLGQLRMYVELVAARETDQNFQAKFGNSDLIQQSMTKAVENFDQFGGTTEAELFAWTRKILENELRQLKRAYRSEKRDIFRERPLQPHAAKDEPGELPSIQLPDRQLTPRSRALQNENHSLMKRAIQALPEEYRMVILLRNWEKLSFSEIGQRMNRSENAATKLWYRALVKLRRALETQSE